MSIMATIRWCPIFPKWNIYQPLENPLGKPEHGWFIMLHHASTWAFGCFWRLGIGRTCRLFPIIHHSVHATHILTAGMGTIGIHWDPLGSWLGTIGNHWDPVLPHLWQGLGGAAARQGPKARDKPQYVCPFIGLDHLGLWHASQCDILYVGSKLVDHFQPPWTIDSSHAGWLSCPGLSHGSIASNCTHPGTGNSWKFYHCNFSWIKLDSGGIVNFLAFLIQVAVNSSPKVDYSTWITRTSQRRGPLAQTLHESMRQQNLTGSELTRLPVLVTYIKSH